MLLTREEILKQISNQRIQIRHFNPNLVRENGIDLRLDSQYAVPFEPSEPLYIDVSRTKPEEIFVVHRNVEKIVIPPRGFILACTLEYIKLPEDIVGICTIRSTFARWGLSVPPTVVDAGFEGQLTIEIINNTPYSIVIRPKTPFLHLVLFKTKGKAKYNGTYLGQLGVRLPKNVHPVE